MIAADPTIATSSGGEPARRDVGKRLVVREPACDAREIAEVRGGVVQLNDERARAGDDKDVAVKRGQRRDEREGVSGDDARVASSARDCDASEGDDDERR